MTKNKRICVGEIATVHGVRGLVKVRTYGEDVDTLEKYGPLYDSETGGTAHKISLKHQSGGAWIASVDDITDRNEAEKLRGVQLWLDRSALPASNEENGYYHADLIGLDAFSVDGTAWGKVIGVDNFGAGDLLEIKPDGQASFYLPFVDMYVTGVDLDANRITIDMPEGLVD